MKIYCGFGKLIYSDNPCKLIVNIENDIANYYRSLIPKHFRFQKPMYDTHISVIRQEEILIPFNWKKFQGNEINFYYDNFIFDNAIYYWLGVYCDILKDIRTELGLPSTNAITASPDSGHEFHITIANTKF